MLEGEFKVRLYSVGGENAEEKKDSV